MQKWFSQFLFKPFNIAPLASFRFLFGLSTLISTCRFLWLGWVDLHFIDTQVQFKYFGFEWVPLLSPLAMYALHGLLIIASLGIMLGAFYRFASIVFFIVFTWLELIDLTYYLNHYYFVSLIALILVFLPAHKNYSLDAFWGRVKVQNEVPAFALNLIKFQLLLVYFMAGIAKLHPEWLMDAMPLKLWLPAQSDMPLIGPLLNYPVTAYVFSWAGMLFDICIPFLLLYPPTQLLAWLVVVFFHSITGYFFQIGVFPLVMIVSTLIVFKDSFHIKLLQSLGFKNGSEPNATYLWPSKMNLIAGIILCWISFQLLFPFRYIAYPGNFFWTEQGYRFGWRVMLFEKAGTATFFVVDDATHKEGVVDNTEFLNSHQEKQMAMQPDMILQYAAFLKKHYESKGLMVSWVRAEVYVTLNGRPSQLLFSPQLNLLEINDSWSHKNWINALED